MSKIRVVYKKNGAIAIDENTLYKSEKGIATIKGCTKVSYTARFGKTNER